MFIFEDNLAEQKNILCWDKARFILRWKLHSSIAVQYAANGWHVNTMPVVS